MQMTKIMAEYTQRNGEDCEPYELETLLHNDFIVSMQREDGYMNIRVSDPDSKHCLFRTKKPFTLTLEVGPKENRPGNAVSPKIPNS